MCVGKCECNNCQRKQTCTDCVYMSKTENKEVNCSKDGIQRCPFRRR